MSDDASEPCGKCGHDWDPHILVPTMYDPMLGGLLFCQEPGCLCQATWSIEGNPEPYIPTDDDVDYLRDMAQSADLDDADDVDEADHHD